MDLPNAGFPDGAAFTHLPDLPQGFTMDLPDLPPSCLPDLRIYRIYQRIYLRHGMDLPDLPHGFTTDLPDLPPSRLPDLPDLLDLPTDLPPGWIYRLYLRHSVASQFDLKARGPGSGLHGVYTVCSVVRR